MSNCAWSSDVPVIIDNNQVQAGSSGVATNQKFRFFVQQNEVVTFYVTIPYSNFPTLLYIKVFKIDEVTHDMTLVSTSQLTEPVNSISGEFQKSEYLVCISSQFPLAFTLRINFTIYNGAIISPEFINSINFRQTGFYEKPAGICTSELQYELVPNKGELPEGISMRNDGIIYGVPVEQDCVTPKYISPSYTWSSENAGKVTTVPYVYEFTVRAKLVDYPAQTVTKKFKICVNNNWDYDAQAFIETLKNSVKYTYKKEEYIVYE